MDPDVEILPPRQLFVMMLLWTREVFNMFLQILSLVLFLYLFIQIYPPNEIIKHVVDHTQMFFTTTSAFQWIMMSQRYGEGFETNNWWSWFHLMLPLRLFLCTHWMGIKTGFLFSSRPESVTSKRRCHFDRMTDAGNYRAECTNYAYTKSVLIAFTLLLANLVCSVCVSRGQRSLGYYQCVCVCVCVYVCMYVCMCVCVCVCLGVLAERPLLRTNQLTAH